VTACPTDAIVYGEYKELKPLIERGEILPHEGKAPVKARVYYLGIPKRFIAGEVYSPWEDQCLEGVQLTLREVGSGKEYQGKTDNYGDFWLEGLERGRYSLLIEKEGYYPKELQAIDTEKDINLGEIRLYKKF
jgi:tetrathionate reductase subunit B